MNLEADRDIVRAFRAGDDAAVTVLYDRYGRLVFTVAVRILNDRADAEEATQQTFVQAWRHASQFDESKPFGPWLATIARRVAIDIVRKRTRQDHDSLDATKGQPHSVSPGDSSLVSLPPNPEQIETVWRVREALDSLSQDDRELMRLHHFEGHTQSTIADTLAIPIGTVKSRMYRIHHELAEALRSLRMSEEQS